MTRHQQSMERMLTQHENGGDLVDLDANVTRLNTQVTEVKADVRSLKALLLSRKQFPPVPSQ